MPRVATYVLPLNLATSSASASVHSSSTRTGRELPPPADGEEPSSREPQQPMGGKEEAK